MTLYEKVCKDLIVNPKTWLVTGVAGFIGSNLLEKLLLLNQTVVGLDNFATGHQHNLDEVQSLVNEEQWSRFTFIDGDIRDFDTCKKALQGINYVLHQSALGSVPRSIQDPLTSNAANITGFLNLLYAAKEEKVDSFTYAASSSTYGDHQDLPKREENIGNPLSPYAVTKYVNELYAGVFEKTYGFKSIGLRYFNVFGKRQDPEGAYAAVIPKWIKAFLKKENIYINGDGKISRDFTYIDNVVQANIIAATTETNNKNEIYNVGLGGQISLNELVEEIKKNIKNSGSVVINRENRKGDVQHSRAEISKIQKKLGYEVLVNFNVGLEKTITWFKRNIDK